MQERSREMSDKLRLKIGDLVIRRSGSMSRPAEVRGLFVSRRGKQMLALEYDSELFRIVREQQVQKVENENDND